MYNLVFKGVNLFYRDGVNIYSSLFFFGLSDLEGVFIIFFEFGRFSYNRFYILIIFIYKFKVYYYKMDKIKKKNIIISKVWTLLLKNGCENVIKVLEIV